MTKIQALVVSAALAIGMAVPASAATTDPEVLIYRFPGVRDDGSVGGVGVATAFFCTNFSGVTETLRFVTRNGDTVIASNLTIPIEHLTTKSAQTHATLYANVNLFLPAPGGGINSGTTAIAATSTNIICTAMVIDAANTKPTFAVSLRGIRFNSAPGSQE